jgi:hypothetical protein
LAGVLVGGGVAEGEGAVVRVGVALGLCWVEVDEGGGGERVGSDEGVGVALAVPSSVAEEVEVRRGEPEGEGVTELVSTWVAVVDAAACVGAKVVGLTARRINEKPASKRLQADWREPASWFIVFPPENQSVNDYYYSSKLELVKCPSAKLR